jgi:hypothetical protein
LNLLTFFEIKHFSQVWFSWNILTHLEACSFNIAVFNKIKYIYLLLFPGVWRWWWWFWWRGRQREGIVVSIVMVTIVTTVIHFSGILCHKEKNLTLLIITTKSFKYTLLPTVYKSVSKMIRSRSICHVCLWGQGGSVVNGEIVTALINLLAQI